MNNIDIINKLKEHLNLSKINHEEEIMKLSTLKEAHIYVIINKLSAQQYGPLLEKFIVTKFKYIKNKAEDCIGDCVKDGKNTEVKVSLGGKTHSKFNYVQLRPFHKCDTYILTAYHLSEENVNMYGELYLFRIPKEDMKKIIITYGGYAHGTIKENGNITEETMYNENNNKEYALRPIYNDKCWKALLLYRFNEDTL
jgi:hypothetical protein